MLPKALASRRGARGSEPGACHTKCTWPRSCITTRRHWRVPSKMEQSRGTQKMAWCGAVMSKTLQSSKRGGRKALKAAA